MMNTSAARETHPPPPTPNSAAIDAAGRRTAPTSAGDSVGHAVDGWVGVSVEIPFIIIDPIGTCSRLASATPESTQVARGIGIAVTCATAQFVAKSLSHACETLYRAVQADTTPRFSDLWHFEWRILGFHLCLFAILALSAAVLRRAVFPQARHGAGYDCLSAAAITAILAASKIAGLVVEPLSSTAASWLTLATGVFGAFALFALAAANSGERSMRLLLATIPVQVALVVILMEQLFRGAGGFFTWKL